MSGLSRRPVPRRWTPGSVLLGALLLAGAVGPLLLLGVWSLAGAWFYPALLPGEWSLRAWASALSPDTPLWASLWGSVWVGTVTAVTATALALPAARALNGWPGRSRAWVQSALLAPLILPAFAGVMGIQVVFIRLGLADTPAGVVAAHLIVAVPYAVAVLSATFAGYDARLEDAARTLGASRTAVWWQVTLPAVRSGVLVALLMAFLVSWSEYLLTLIVGGAQVRTLPLLLFSAVQGGDYALSGALGLVYLLPPLLGFALLAPRLRSAA